MLLVADRVTAKDAWVVPALPSVTVAPEIEIEGAPLSSKIVPAP
jgi:hypothetical protein